MFYFVPKWKTPTTAVSGVKLSTGETITAGQVVSTLGLTRFFYNRTQNDKKNQKKNLKMGQKMQKMSLIIKKSCCLWNTRALLHADNIETPNSWDSTSNFLVARSEMSFLIVFWPKIAVF